MCLIPNSFSSGAEFYFLGEKRHITLTQDSQAYLSGDTLYLSAKDTDKKFSKFLFFQSQDILLKYVNKVYKEFEKYRVPYLQIVIKPLKSQWGDCQPATGKITLNLYLLATPPECIYYVVVHEFANFLHPNH